MATNCRQKIGDGIIWSNKVSLINICMMPYYEVNVFLSCRYVNLLLKKNKIQASEICTMNL